MKLYAIIGIFVLAAAFFSMPASENCEIETHFCPEDDCEGVILEEIGGAKKTIHAAVYSFTLESVALELKKARARGVEVKVVVEKSGTNSKYSQYDNLSHYGIDILVDGNAGQMHNKFVVIDGKRVLTGSANWSRNSISKNNDNIVVFECEQAKEYENAFWDIWLQGSYE